MIEALPNEKGWWCWVAGHEFVRKHRSIKAQVLAAVLTVQDDACGQRLQVRLEVTLHNHRIGIVCQVVSGLGGPGFWSIRPNPLSNLILQSVY